jgi:hypothetical protein
MFLPHLYRHNRPLFWTALLFIGGSLFAIGFRHQSTPFYLWAMYSTPMPAATEYEYYVLAVNGDEHYFTPSCSDYRTYFYINSLPAYTALREGRIQPPKFATLSWLGMKDFLRHLTPDSSVAAAYPAWLRRYVSARVDAPLQRLEVRRIFLRYTSSTEVERVREEVVAVL